MLEIRNFSNYILKDVSFELPVSKNLIILGSNGCGKTTLAKTLSGIISNDSVKIDNNNISKLYGDKRTSLINYLPSKLTIFDEHINVDEFLSLSDLYSKKNIVEVLKLLNISTLKSKSCKNLSSGESQLVLLASGILHNAKYTIFDEITSNLDPSKLKMVFDILTSKDYFNSKIIITHNLHFAYKLGFDIIFIQDGKIIFNNSNKEFFSDENLKKFFCGSVKKIDKHIVVDI
ncbi:MAG: ABC transporter ATP-binding protein [Campylobacterota bacterium]|nr:ABC transporter ATP-binding protein [Campylobacterota bacterium]